MPRDIPEGITANHVRLAIADFDAGVSHEFGESTGYDLVYEGRRYPPKAIAGLAAAHVEGGEQLGPYDFKGGEESKCFRLLRSLGFVIEPKTEVEVSVKARAGGDWSDEELRASVDTYLEMFALQRLGKPFVKKGYYRELAKRFGRGEGAYERRAQNISHVLALLGREWIPGLVPAENVGVNVVPRLEKVLAEAEGRAVTEDASFEATVRAARGKSDPDKPPDGNAKPTTAAVAATNYVRCPKVKAWVLDHANGVCEACGAPAPFETAPDGDPFLEVRHVRRLADGGSDRVENAVALCPNCHRAFHHARDRVERVGKLYQQVERLERE